MTTAIESERIDAALRVGTMPPRVAHVTYAVIVACRENGGGPVRPREIIEYDWESRSLASTCSALRTAMAHELVGRWGRGLYSPSPKAYELRDALADRYNRDEEATSSPSRSQSTKGERR